MDLRCRVYTDFMHGPKVYIEKMRELVNSLRTCSWTSLASSAKRWVWCIINRGLWLVSRSQTLVARTWLYARLGCCQVSAIWK